MILMPAYDLNACSLPCLTLYLISQILIICQKQDFPSLPRPFYGKISCQERFPCTCTTTDQKVVIHA